MRPAGTGRLRRQRSLRRRHPAPDRVYNHCNCNHPARSHGIRLAQNQTGAYYFDVVSDKVLRENYGGDFEACFKSGLQQYIDRYAATLTPEEVLTAISSTGDASYTYQWLGDNTKYYILAAGITTAEPGTTTKVEYSEFETLPLIKNEFTFSDITPTDLSVKATVSSADPELRYVTYLVEKRSSTLRGSLPKPMSTKRTRN